jgi:AraC-like DNA-binding protein
MYNLISDYSGHLFSTSGRYACGIKYDTHEGGKSMEMNSVMATEIVTTEVEHIVLPQIVSIKQASQMLGLPPYYLRRLCKEVPGIAFQSGIKWYINLGKLVDYYNHAGKFTAV